MHTKPVDGCTCSLCERERARSAVPSALENAARIQLTSQWQGALRNPSSMWKRRGDSQEPTVESSYLFAETTPASMSDSYYKPTTGQPQSTPSGIAGGPPATTSNSTSEKQSQTHGCTAKALTYDAGKAPLAHLPWAAVEALSRVQMYGHKKYKDFNNYRKGMEVTRNLSCALRHLKDYLEGHDKDPESGESPLAHALCRVAFVLQNIHDGTAIDDRYKDDTRAKL